MGAFAVEIVFAKYYSNSIRTKISNGTSVMHRINSK